MCVELGVLLRDRGVVYIDLVFEVGTTFSEVIDNLLLHTVRFFDLDTESLEAGDQWGE